jgi:hypothetical protein
MKDLRTSSMRSFSHVGPVVGQDLSFLHLCGLRAMKYSSRPLSWSLISVLFPTLLITEQKEFAPCMLVADVPALRGSFERFTDFISIPVVTLEFHTPSTVVSF